MDKQIYNYCRYSLQVDIEDLLRDPVGMGFSTDEIIKYVENLSKLCKKVDMEFWDVAKKLGTQRELDKLKQLLSKV